MTPRPHLEVASASPELRRSRTAQSIKATFSPDGRLVATGCADLTARVWEAAVGEARTLPLPHPSSVFGLYFSPDSKGLLVPTLGQKLSSGMWVQAG